MDGSISSLQLTRSLLGRARKQKSSLGQHHSKKITNQNLHLAHATIQKGCALLANVAL